MCGTHVEGSRICSNCMFDLMEEESIGNSIFSPGRLFSVVSNVHSGAGPHFDDFVVHTFRRSGHNCNHCWPMDCRCY